MSRDPRYTSPCACPLTAAPVPEWKKKENPMTLPPMPRLSRPRLRRLALLCLSLCLPLLGRAATAATLNVPSAAYPTIQSAVNAAASGDTVLLADGTYTGPGNVDVIIVGTGITVQSQNGAAKTIIDCGGYQSGDDSGNHRGFLLGSGSSATLSGLTITNGYESDHQGGFGGGGAVSLFTNAALTLNGCVVADNYADDGGGFYSVSSSTLTLSGCAVTYNRSYNEGGGLNVDSVTLTRCIVADNECDTAGTAGLFANSVAATDCVIADNASNGSDGGVTAVTAANLTNCAIFGSQGSGVHSDGAATLTNCTITANNGDGIIAANGLMLTNDIVYGETGGLPEISARGTVSVSYSDVQQASGVYAGTGNINADPLFVSDTDLHLRSGSPCLGAGTPNGAPTTTLDGFARPNPPSIGAFEAETRTPTTLTTPNVTSMPGKTVTLSARLKAGGTNLAGRTLTFTVEGVPVGSAVTNGSGVANVLYAVPVGTMASIYGVDVTFAGDAAYAASSIMGTLTVVKADTALTVPNVTGTRGKKVTLSARLKSGTNNLAGRTVRFTVDGTAVGSAVTNGSGVANLFYAIPVGTTPGSHTIGASFAKSSTDPGYRGSDSMGTLTVN